MPHYQNIGDKTICCVSCGKVIAKGHISTGRIEIKCKCGVTNKIEAENKPEGRNVERTVAKPNELRRVVA